MFNCDTGSKGAISETVQVTEDLLGKATSALIHISL